MVLNMLGFFQLKKSATHIRVQRKLSYSDYFIYQNIYFIIPLKSSPAYAYLIHFPYRKLNLYLEMMPCSKEAQTELIPCPTESQTAHAFRRILYPLGLKSKFLDEFRSNCSSGFLNLHSFRLIAYVLPDSSSNIKLKCCLTLMLRKMHFDENKVKKTHEQYNLHV